MNYLNQNQLTKLLEFLESKRNEDPWCCAIELLVHSGMRTQELAILSSDKIDLIQGRIKVKAVKGSNDRQVPIDLELLKSFMESRRHYAHIEVDSFKRMLRERWDKVKLECFGFNAPKVSLHGLRATFAMSQYAALNNDVLMVKQLLGHKSILSTMHYVEACQLEQKEEMILGAFSRANLTRRK